MEEREPGARRATVPTDDNRAHLERCLAAANKGYAEGLANPPKWAVDLVQEQRRHASRWMIARRTQCKQPGVVRSSARQSRPRPTVKRASSASSGSGSDSGPSDQPGEPPRQRSGELRHVSYALDAFLMVLRPIDVREVVR